MTPTSRHHLGPHGQGPPSGVPRKLRTHQVAAAKSPSSDRHECTAARHECTQWRLKPGGHPGASFPMLFFGPTLHQVDDLKKKSQVCCGRATARAKARRKWTRRRWTSCAIQSPNTRATVEHWEEQWLTLCSSNRSSSANSWWSI